MRHVLLALIVLFTSNCWADPDDRIKKLEDAISVLDMRITSIEHKLKKDVKDPTPKPKQEVVKHDGLDR